MYIICIYSLVKILHQWCMTANLKYKFKLNVNVWNKSAMLLYRNAEINLSNNLYCDI